MASEPHMTCTECGGYAGDLPDSRGLSPETIAILCREWKCTRCLDEREVAERDLDDAEMPG